MKTTIGILLSIVLCATHLACSPIEEQQFADEHPRLAPATQAIESIQRRIDPLADAAQKAAGAVQNAASDAAGLGMPGAGGVAMLAGLVGTVLGIYKERRTGTVPLRAAFEQVVQSVEAAFPAKTDQQKAALAAAQDRTTKSLVAKVKAS